MSRTIREKRAQFDDPAEIARRNELRRQHEDARQAAQAEKQARDVTFRLMKRLALADRSPIAHMIVHLTREG